jgi:hypothetical protein
MLMLAGDFGERLFSGARRIHAPGLSEQFQKTIHGLRIAAGVN